MADERRKGASDDGPDERTDKAREASSPPSPEATRGGAWLTYRYRLSGADTPVATGTIKAPSFLTAARRVLARGLGATGASPSASRAAGSRVAQSGG